EVSDISGDIIQKIYEADILIIDANGYEINGTLQLPPYLYYYIAIGHSRGNATILVTSAKKHLPHELITYHTLVYSDSVRDFQRFTDQFNVAVEEIRQRKNERKPDNPIHSYLQREALAKAHQRIAEMEQEVLDKARQRIAEMEQEVLEKAR